MRCCALVAFFLLASCAQAQESPPSSADILVVDGRADAEKTPPGPEWSTAPPLVQAQKAARTYWQQQDASYEEEAAVLAVAEGAFTEPGTQQHAVLYLMSRWPRCCPKVGLAVVDGDRLVYNAAFERSTYDLTAVPDLDGDGRDELLFNSSFGMGGEWTRAVTLARIGSDGLTDWGGTMVSYNSCAGRGDPGEAFRVTARPGPTFATQRFTRADCEATTWTNAGVSEPLVFEPPAETSPYTALPLR